jgi:hypothetical protein
MRRATFQWAISVADELTSAGHGPRKRRRGRTISGPEQLDQRIVPAGSGGGQSDITTWTNGAGTGLWSNPKNWNNGLPSPIMVAVLAPVNGQSGTITYDPAVPQEDQTIGGLTTSSNFQGTLALAAGFPLTVSSVPNSSTGFQWTVPASITQATANDILIITGGGTAANNVWSNGSIGNTTTQGEVDIKGATTLQITGSASTLGDNLIIGADSFGGSTVEFYNQGQTLNLTNNAGILVQQDTDDGNPPNQILFDTNENQIGMANVGLSGSASSFIDNFGTITRSNPGTYQINVPIKNEVGQVYNGQLVVQSSTLYVSGQSPKTAGYAVDQVGGITILASGGTLQVPATNGYLMSGGDLYTQGSGNDTITGAVNVTGGTIEVSQDNPSNYGTLVVNGGMSWSGGTFQAYVNGTTSNQQTQLEVTGILSLGSGAILNMNWVGSINEGTWTPIAAPSPSYISGTLTFNGGGVFTIDYVGSPVTSIQVTANE